MKMIEIQCVVRKAQTRLHAQLSEARADVEAIVYPEESRPSVSCLVMLSLNKSEPIYRKAGTRKPFFMNVMMWGI